MEILYLNIHVLVFNVHIIFTLEYQYIIFYLRIHWYQSVNADNEHYELQINLPVVSLKTKLIERKKYCTDSLKIDCESIDIIKYLINAKTEDLIKIFKIDTIPPSFVIFFSTRTPNLEKQIENIKKNLIGSVNIDESTVKNVLLTKCTEDYIICHSEWHSCTILCLKEYELCDIRFHLKTLMPDILYQHENLKSQFEISCG